jgi:hypothetical protein
MSAIADGTDVPFARGAGASAACERVSPVNSENCWMRICEPCATASSGGVVPSVQT